MPKKISSLEKIVDAMEILLKRKPINEIRITELCEVAGVSRRTFYNNNCDIFDVAPNLWDRSMSSSLYLVGKIYGWHEAHQKMFESLLSKKDFFQKAFLERDFNSVLEHGYRKARDIDVETAESKLSRLLTNGEYLELDYLIRALSSMTAKWVVDGMMTRPERMTDIFQKSIPEWLINLFGE